MARVTQLQDKRETTTEHIAVEKVCEAAKECESILILGVDKDGDFYFAASDGEEPQLLWLVEHFKHRLLSGTYRD